MSKPNPTSLIHQVLTNFAAAQPPDWTSVYIDATAGRGHDTAFLCRLAAAGSHPAQADSQGRRLVTAEDGSRTERLVTAEGGSRTERLATAEGGSRTERLITAEGGFRTVLEDRPQSSAQRPVQVLAFDIQREALTSTAERLAAQGIPFSLETKESSPAPPHQYTTNIPGKVKLNIEEAADLASHAPNSVTEKAACRLILDSHENLASYAAPGSAGIIMFNFGYLPGGDHSLATRPHSSLRALAAALDLLTPGGLISLCIYHGGDSGYAEKEALLAWLRQLDQSRYTALVLDFANRPGDPPIPAFLYKHG